MDGIADLCVAMIERALRDISRRDDIATSDEDAEEAFDWIMSDDMGLLSLHFCVDLGCDILTVQAIREHAIKSRNIIQEQAICIPIRRESHS